MTARGIRTGTVPALADGFTSRPESAPGLAALLVPGAAVALASAATAPSGRSGQPRQPPGPAGSSGKTQLAAHLAEALWRSGQVDLLAWIDASSRAVSLVMFERG